MFFNTVKIREVIFLNFKIDVTELEVVEKLKLLGAKVTNDLKWNVHTTYLTKEDFTIM